MEENKRELNPEEMESASGGRGKAYEAEFKCPFCGFQSTNPREIAAHIDSHADPLSRPPRP